MRHPHDFQRFTSRMESGEGIYNGHQGDPYRQLSVKVFEDMNIFEIPLDGKCTYSSFVLFLTLGRARAVDGR